MNLDPIIILNLQKLGYPTPFSDFSFIILDISTVKCGNNSYIDHPHIIFVYEFTLFFYYSRSINVLMWFRSIDELVVNDTHRLTINMKDNELQNLLCIC